MVKQVTLILAPAQLDRLRHRILDGSIELLALIWCKRGNLAGRMNFRSEQDILQVAVADAVDVLASNQETLDTLFWSSRGTPPAAGQSAQG